jgi:hypothetical protein
LQRERYLAGLGNFSIFQPTNELDYVPDEDFVEESGIQEIENGLLAHVATHFRNPERRKMMIKNRVFQNFATTSSTCNLLDSILNEQDATLLRRNNSSDFIMRSGKNLKMKQNVNEQQNSFNNNPSTSIPPSQEKKDGKSSDNARQSQNIESSSNVNETSLNDQNFNDQQSSSSSQLSSSNNKPLNKTPQKKKKPVLDMFDESSQPVVEEEEELPNECPNFSIYNCVNSDEKTPELPDASDDLMDIVQMSDGEQHNFSEDIEPLEPIVVSQPASPDNIPDLENERKKESLDERSYTPPIVTHDKKNEEKEKRKKDHDYHNKKSKRKEIERYNVRERLKER